MKRFINIMYPIVLILWAAGNFGHELGNTWAGLWAGAFVVSTLMTWAELYNAITRGRFS